MPVHWKRKPHCDIDTVIAQLDECRVTDSSGRVAFTDKGDLHDLLLILRNACTCHPDIPAAVSRRFVLRSLCRAGELPPLSRQSVLIALRAQATAYLHKPVQKYFLCTCLSMNVSTLPKPCKMQGTTFTFSRKRPKGYATPDLPPGVNERLSRMSQHVVWVRVGVEGRNELAAGLSALHALTLLRGLWNLHLNRQVIRSMSTTPRSPNQIISGPLYTLHVPGGQVATEQHWYEREHHPKEFLQRDLSPAMAAMEDARRYWQRRIRLCAYGDMIESAVCRYCIAMDSADHENVFAQLWSVLESLTIQDDESTDLILRRAAFVWNRPRHHKYVLRVLRQLRNKQVHEGLFDADAEESLYILKRYVEQMLLFHLHSHMHFKTIRASQQFLDLPIERDEIVETRRRLTEALKWSRQRTH